MRRFLKNLSVVLGIATALSALPLCAMAVLWVTDIDLAYKLAWHYAQATNCGALPLALLVSVGISWVCWARAAVSEITERERAQHALLKELDYRS